MRGAKGCWRTTKRSGTRWFWGSQQAKRGPSGQLGKQKERIRKEKPWLDGDLARKGEGKKRGRLFPGRIFSFFPKQPQLGVGQERGGGLSRAERKWDFLSMNQLILIGLLCSKLIFMFVYRGGGRW